MANMTLEVILELVNRLTGPAREAGKDLEQFGAAISDLDRSAAEYRERRVLLRATP